MKAWWVAILADPDDDARSFVKTHGLVAADVMTRGVIGVDQTDTEIGKTLRNRTLAATNPACQAQGPRFAHLKPAICR